MTDHPITPPPELRQLWAQQAQRMDPHDPVAWLEHIATQSARWGADQELKACYEWVVRDWTDIQSADMLLATRRPKPPSLKEQAMQAWCRFQDTAHKTADEMMGDMTTIRRALEALPE